MFGIGGHENKQGRFDLHDPLHHRKSVKSRHLDIEKYQIRLQGLDLANRFPAIAAGIHNFDIVEFFEPYLQSLDRELFVVD